MRRSIAVVFCLLLATSVSAQEPDCSTWSLKGLHPGMTFDEASAGHSFLEFKKFRDPLGYRRYVWQAPDRPEKIELHVDVATEPPRVIGVMSTIPSDDMVPREFLDQLIERWGPPRKQSGQGAFTLYTFGSTECDVSARVSVMNQEHQVGVWIALNSIVGRDEYARRKREAGRNAGEETATEPVESEDPATAGDD